MQNFGCRLSDGASLQLNATECPVTCQGKSPLLEHIDFITAVLLLQVISGVTPQVQFVKVVNDELVELMGSAGSKDLEQGNPQIILMAGLQVTHSLLCASCSGGVIEHFVRSMPCVITEPKPCWIRDWALDIVGLDSITLSYHKLVGGCVDSALLMFAGCG